MAFIKRSTSKNSLMPVAGCRSVDRLKVSFIQRYLLLKRVASSGRQWKRILCCSRWLKVAPLVVDRLKAPIQTTVSRVEWSGVEWKAVDRLKGA
jgi:hypothetical protein